MEDEKIIALYFARDEQALLQTGRKYGGFCYAIAHNILKNEEDAKECVNDTWFKAWTVIPPKRPSVFRAFLAKITRNLALDRYRRSRAVKRGGGAMEVIFDELSECIGTQEMERHTDALAISQALQQFLAGQPQEARLIFVRRYWYADSVEQIAERYGMSESKVKSALLRSRTKLRAFLEREGISI